MKLALALTGFFAFVGCGTNEPRPAPVSSAEQSGDASSQPRAHCCSVPVPDGGGSTCHAGNIIEPCWNNNAAGDYARWTCSSQSGASVFSCSDNGRNCDIGAPCAMPDVGCSGVVEECDYPWWPYPGSAAGVDGG